MDGNERRKCCHWYRGWVHESTHLQAEKKLMRRPSKPYTVQALPSKQCRPRPHPQLARSHSLPFFPFSNSVLWMRIWFYIKYFFLPCFRFSSCVLQNENVFLCIYIYIYIYIHTYIHTHTHTYGPRPVLVPVQSI